jgi:hypothetical protein
MATRCYIARKTSSDYQAVYAHWDGSPEHNGRILFDHYSNPRKLRRLMSKGDISILTPIVGRKHKFENGRTVRSTTFYGRDRAEKGIETKSWNSVDQVLKAADQCGTEYVYLYDRGTWHVAGRGLQFFGSSDGSPFSSFRPLADVLTCDSSPADDK